MEDDGERTFGEAVVRIPEVRPDLERAPSSQRAADRDLAFEVPSVDDALEHAVQLANDPLGPLLRKELLESSGASRLSRAWASAT